MRPRLLLAGLAVVAALLAGTGIVLWNGFESQPGQTASIGGPFHLVGPGGKPVSDRDFRGRYMLVYFGYTTCPDLCPTTLSEVASAMDKLGPKAARVQPLFITVDPARDTPDVVRQYTAAFTPLLEGLTGTPEQVRAVAEAYRVYYARHDTGPGPNDYSMDHSSVLYLMGPDGSFIAPIRADETGTAMAADLDKRVS
jgi:protein SCO1/2